MSVALSYQYLSSLAFVASGALFYIFIAKFLSTSDVGTVSLLLAITGLLNILFSFSLPISAQHFISYYLGKGDHIEMYSITKRLIVISLLLSIGSIVFTLLMARPIATLFFHSYKYTFLVETASIFAAALIMLGILHGSALGLQLFKTDAVVYISSASLSYLVGFIFVLIFHSILYLFIGLTLSYIWGSILYSVIIFAKKPLIRESSRKTPLSFIFSYSWPIILSSLIGYGSQYVDRFVVAYFLDISTLGIYSFVLLISSSIGYFAGPIPNILIPKLSEFFSLKDKERLRKGVNLASAVIVLIYAPISLGVASIAPVVLSLLARSVYGSGYVALTILLGVSSIFVLGGMLSSVVYAIRRTRVYVLSASVTLLSNVILSFILIPKFGMVGAAIANSSVGALSFVVLYYYAIVKEIGSFDWITILKIWSSAVVMFIVVYAEGIIVGRSQDMLPLFIVTGAVTYLVSLNLTRSLGRFNREEFLSYVPIRFSIRQTVKIFLVRAF
jgi:O-antigen/teichoic acid export membrane protein